MIVELGAVYMTMHEFDVLPEYSCSLPTGATAGKRWKRGIPYMMPRRRWLMGEYGTVNSLDQVPITWREIFIRTGSES
jgi:hypothetical protein